MLVRTAIGSTVTGAVIVRVSGRKYMADPMEMNLFEIARKEDYRAYKEDVDIAIEELTKMKLYPVDGITVCDLYAIPSHNCQSYYAIICERGSRFDIIYAKPQFYEPTVQEYIKMYRFKDAKEVENHPVKDGKIIMGIKHLPDEFVSIIKDIVSNLPTLRHKDEGFVLDGYFQAIGIYKNNDVCGEVVFKCVDELVFPEGKEYLSGVLDELYIRIDELIE